MKASELQIGDLIYVYGQNGNILAEPHWYVRKVTADWLVDMDKSEAHDKKLKDYGVVLPDEQSFIGDTKPIPITEDMLRENFTLWHQSEYRKEYEYDKEDGYVNVIMRPSHFYLHVMVGNDEFNFHMKVSFVHELQHALRLCGLNELADNFKVE